MEAGFTCTVFSSINELSSFLPEQQDVFCSINFFKALEASPIKGIKNRYVVFQDSSNKPVGFGYFQLKHFIGTESLPELGQQKDSLLKKLVKKGLNTWGIICGNLLLTGEHGFSFNTTISTQKKAQMLRMAENEIVKQAKTENLSISFSLYKDYASTPENEDFAQLLQQLNFHKIEVQPSMMLDIKPNWASFNDYTAALAAKYRTRVNRAFKKSETIVCTQMTLEEVLANQETLFQLYQKVVERQSFSMFTLNPNYFYELKKALGSKLIINAYWLEGTLIAFSTGIDNGHELNAHFLGLDDQYNTSHQLYLRILLDLIDMGIKQKNEVVNFSRTALEIKSSVGAEPMRPFVLLRAHNRLVNWLLPYFFDLLNPSESWTPRAPFK